MKKYEFKSKVLRTLLQGNKSSREIYEQVGHPNYGAYRSALFQLKRRGYISIDKDVNPRIYSLTKLGKEHAENPLKYKEIKYANLQRRVSQILNDNEMFQEAVANEVKNRFPSITSPFGNSPSSQNVNPHVETAHLMAELKSKESEIMRLNRILELMQKQTATGKPRLPPTKSPQEEKQEQERVLRRQKLARAYASRRHMLDFRFFKSWGDMWPYKMKHLQLYKNGSVEILGMSNPEHGRGHTRGMLDEGGIIGAVFFIKQMRKDGIVVSGKGMAEDKLLRW
ncbi:hypothetical protein [Methanolobus sp.]|uniref:hypothetical protein n=1 Tax=Methanolobus sp. TaxID=1874737 RepID=UPI0025D9E50F|nr:hypothetical protein [Methanolobus sp.]